MTDRPRPRAHIDGIPAPGTTASVPVRIADAGGDVLVAWALSGGAPAELGEIDQAVWNALPVALTAESLAADPAIGTRVLCWTPSGCHWASSEHAGVGLPAASVWRRFADVLAYVAPFDDEVRAAATTLLRCGPYRDMLEHEAADVQRALAAAHAAAEAEAQADWQRDNGWIVDTQQQLADAGRPPDPAMPPLAKLDVDTTSLRPYHRELARLEAVARAVDVRKRAALEVLQQRAEQIVTLEDAAAPQAPGRR